MEAEMAMMPEALLGVHQEQGYRCNKISHPILKAIRPYRGERERFFK
jgi:hypothetical protein